MCVYILYVCGCCVNSSQSPLIGCPIFSLIVEYLSSLLAFTLLQLAIDLLLPLCLAKSPCHVQEFVVAKLLAVKPNHGGQRRLWILVGHESETAGASLVVEHKLPGSEKSMRCCEINKPLGGTSAIMCAPPPLMLNSFIMEHAHQTGKSARKSTGCVRNCATWSSICISLTHPHSTPRTHSGEREGDHTRRQTTSNIPYDW